MAEVLDETFGIMVYQEDVSRVAMAMAGFSHTEADRLRKVMSKKDRDHQLGDFHQRFSAGARRRGATDEQIDAVWEMMMSFSGYSFCKPHSASYARVSFQAAYLKVHFPAEFMAAVISNRGGFYGTFAYVSEARRMGLAIRPPDVNRSQIRWTGRGKAIRVGLQAVGDLSGETRARIVTARKQRPFDTPADFFNRSRADEAEARALIKCGALDAINPAGNRAALIWSLASWRKARNAKPKVRTGNLFGTDGPLNQPPRLPPDNEREGLRREFEVLGFLCDRHPMTLFEDTIARQNTVKAVDLPRYTGRRVRIAGWLITAKVVSTKRGDPMEFLTFEDETGVVETTFFPEAYRRFCHLIDRGRPYLLSGKVEADWGATTLTVDSVTPVNARSARAGHR
jgi:DNA polymerase-3 subunit alpha/error-prone DNA polymerase